MSTSFDVFPTVDGIPTFRKLLEVATVHLDDFLRSYGIRVPVPLAVTLRRAEPDQAVVPDLDGPAWWSEDDYAWFHVPGVPGGTDAYAWPLDSDYWRSMGDAMKDASPPEFNDIVAAALRVGRSWSFSRSGGQPAIINIAYGMLAGSLAELTDGIVYSGDGAWDHRRLPARADVFLGNYFRPELNRDWDNYEWANDCIRWLPDELKSLRSEA